jgi:bile acid-coenzyme A ligase
VAVMSFGAACRWLADQDPDRPAITAGSVTFSRREIDERSNRRARLFESLGVEEGDLVTIMLPNGVEFIESALAIWKLGATPQPLSSRLSSRERLEVLEISQPSLVLGADLGEVSGRPSLPLGVSVPAELSSEALPDRVASSWKAPTSGGSTGRPKVVVSLERAVVDPEVGMDAVGLKAGARQLVVAPLYHNAPFVSATQGLLRGGHLIIHEHFSPLATVRALESERVNWVMLVPTMMHRILRLPDAERDRDFGALDGVMHVAGVCPVWVKRAWIDWLGPERMFELYGGTEGQGITIITGEEWLAHPGSVGRPGAHSMDPQIATSGNSVRMEIRDEDGRAVRAGSVGEIWIAVDSQRPVYKYLGQAARDVDGWDSLGDLGSMDEDGYLYIADRRVDMVVTGGANVYPAEVEAQLLAHPAVEGCVVIGLPDDDMGRRVHAIVQTNTTVSKEDFDVFLQTRLAAYKMPRSYERIGEIPRDEAGKIRRSALAEERSREASLVVDSNTVTTEPEANGNG